MKCARVQAPRFSPTKHDKVFKVLLSIFYSMSNKHVQRVCDEYKSKESVTLQTDGTLLIVTSDEFAGSVSEVEISVNYAERLDVRAKGYSDNLIGASGEDTVKFIDKLLGLE